VRLSELRRTLTAEALVSASFLLAILALAAFVIPATRNVRAQRDLTLQIVTTEVRAALMNGGRPLARVVPAAWSTAQVDSVNETVMADTVEFDVSREAPPSARRGALLSDQISAFNRAQRRAAWTAFLLPLNTGAFTAASGLIGTSGLDEFGGRAITVDPAAMVVASPFTERAWGTVLAHDSRRYEGLLRAQDIITPETQESVARPDVRGSSWCTGVTRHSGGRTDVYCGSLAGMEIGRNEEFSLFTEPGDPSGAYRRLGRGTARSLWQNGIELDGATQSVQSGDVLFTRRTGAMIVSQVVSGVVAGISIVNGQRRFSVVDGPLRPLAIALARGEPGRPDTDTTILSLHVELSRELDSATIQFLGKHKELERVEAVVIDGWTGGVRALAGRSQTGPLKNVPGFEPGFVGSLVKPILATAILSEQPALQSLVVESQPDERVREVHGIPVASFKAGHAGRIDLPTFLEVSSNKYAVELVFASLFGSSTGADVFDAEGNVKLPLLERSALLNGLLKVFDVQPAEDKDEGRDESVWRKTESSTAILASMHRQTWYSPWASRPWLFKRRAVGRERVDSLRGATATALSRFAYGQGYNEWTLLGAAQAIGRVVTGRALSARMLDRRSSDSASAFPWRNSSWSTSIRQGMRGVVRSGTASGLDDRFQRVFGPRGVTVFGKTGTAQTDDVDNRADRNTLGLFIAPKQTGTAAPDCGLAVALAVDYRNGRDPTARSHRDFAEDVIAPLIAKHWGELVSCRP
jgi:hypothetical protein